MTVFYAASVVDRNTIDYIGMLDLQLFWDFHSAQRPFGGFTSQRIIIQSYRFLSMEIYADP